MENMVSEVSEASTRKDGESKAAGLQVASGSDGHSGFRHTQTHTHTHTPLRGTAVRTASTGRMAPDVGPLDQILISASAL